MQARDLVELAALATLHGPLLIGSEAPLPQAGLERYWSASKCRLERWGRAIKAAHEFVGPHATQQRRQNCALLEEVLTGEVLARVWTAVLVAHDRHTGSDTGAIARSVLDGQLEAQNRAMAMLVRGSVVGRQHAIYLNRLRRRTESWSDLLVGNLDTREDVSEFGSDAERTRQFTLDYQTTDRHGWPLLLASLRASFSTLELPSPNPDLNSEIGASVLSFFQPELFDSTGLLRSLWMARLQQTTDETQGLLDELFAVDDEPGPTHSAPRRRF
ncbi:MAG TPA: hypothetical protein VGJ26_16455 [Pirellulales bacterium]